MCRVSSGHRCSYLSITSYLVYLLGVFLLLQRPDHAFSLSINAQACQVRCLPLSLCPQYVLFFKLVILYYVPKVFQLSFFLILRIRVLFVIIFFKTLLCYLHAPSIFAILLERFTLLRVFCSSAKRFSSIQCHIRGRI